MSLVDSKRLQRPCLLRVPCTCGGVIDGQVNRRLGRACQFCCYLQLAPRLSEQEARERVSRRERIFRFVQIDGRVYSLPGWTAKFAADEGITYKAAYQLITGRLYKGWSGLAALFGPPSAAEDEAKRAVAAYTEQYRVSFYSFAGGSAVPEKEMATSLASLSVVGGEPDELPVSSVVYPPHGDLYKIYNLEQLQAAVADRTRFEAERAAEAWRDGVDAMLVHVAGALELLPRHSPCSNVHANQCSDERAFNPHGCERCHQLLYRETLKQAAYIGLPHPPLAIDPSIIRALSADFV